ncbi:hypothetical protein KC207_13765 [Phycicoccus sp. BSK3Z-2]|uniref:Uncharacterized protein n=1 Tax=Phycicoccus avicenniae TaxID=2828860 RepID=A0A941DA74_9MICO|nr:hypothetical protein [Phycicoccus avicenniae]MBR7744356.1 hypothetical protein [Phycicoccus avicenniae]
MLTLYIIMQVGWRLDEDSWVAWLAYPFYVLLLPVGIPVFFVTAVASAMLGGYLGDPRSELVAPVGALVTVVLNALLFHSLATARHPRRSPHDEPQPAEPSS